MTGSSNGPKGCVALNKNLAYLKFRLYEVREKPKEIFDPYPLGYTKISKSFRNSNPT